MAFEAGSNNRRPQRLAAMKAKIVYTLESNVVDEKVISLNQVHVKEYDWEQVVMVYDIRDCQAYPTKISSISIFDHKLLIGGVRYRIISMTSVP